MESIIDGSGVLKLHALTIFFLRSELKNASLASTTSSMACSEIFINFRNSSNDCSHDSLTTCQWNIVSVISLISLLIWFKSTLSCFKSKYVSFRAIFNLIVSFIISFFACIEWTQYSIFDWINSIFLIISCILAFMASIILISEM